MSGQAHLELPRGMSNAEIAEQLVFGESTVRRTSHTCSPSFDLRDRIQAVVLRLRVWAHAVRVRLATSCGHGQDNAYASAPGSRNVISSVRSRIASRVKGDALL